MEFYNVRKRQKVEISDDKMTKVTYPGKGSTKRYAVRAVDDDGTKLTKFVSKEMWDKLDIPEE